MNTEIQHTGAEHITPENTYFPLVGAAARVSLLAWRPSSERVALRKIKELGKVDLEVPDGMAHLLVAQLYEEPRIQKKIEALLHKGKLPLYEWPSRIQTDDQSGAFVNQAELVALLTSGAHLDKGAQATDPPAAPTPAPSASAPTVAVPAPVAAPVEVVSVTPKGVQKREMVKRHAARWPTIETDMKDAGTNGLAGAAKAGERGWREAAALDWAREKSRLLSAPEPGTIDAVMAGGFPSRRHRLAR